MSEALVDIATTTVAVVAGVLVLGGLIGGWAALVVLLGGMRPR